MTASQRGTTVSIPARNGPTWPEIRPSGSGWWKEGMMAIGSSPARKEEMAMLRSGESGVFPKKETDGGADVIAVVVSGIDVAGITT
eukprot:CCRYP_001131-RC/>CCRYP_001131-RC protein AED:0.47 eAED:0.49 QI:0/0/0/1/0/0/2/0/85